MSSTTSRPTPPTNHDSTSTPSHPPRSSSPNYSDPDSNKAGSCKVDRIHHVVTIQPTLKEEPKLRLNLVEVKLKPRDRKELDVNMILAILVMIFFNCPVGSIALLVSVESRRVGRNGQMVIARRLGLCSFVLSFIGILISAAAVGLILFYYAHPHIFGCDEAVKTDGCP